MGISQSLYACVRLIAGVVLQLSFPLLDLPLQAVSLIGKVHLEASGSLLGRGAVSLCLL